MKIGEVAAHAEVSVDTVRFYERKGLLPAPARRSSGYRNYAASAVRRVRFVKKVQQLGFSLEEVVELLADVDRGTATCAEERPRFDAVLARIDEKLSRLSEMRSRLVAQLAGCEQGECGLLA